MFLCLGDGMRNDWMVRRHTVLRGSHVTFNNQCLLGTLNFLERGAGPRGPGGIYLSF
jgi:hypothetical protein